ncbi:MAG: hypothetical protein WBX01_12280 [Nitrososphaeraceae archaeon]
MEIKTIAAVAIVAAMVASLTGTTVLVSDASATVLENGRDGHGGGQFNDQDEQNWNNQQDDSDFHCLACFGGVEVELD